MVAIPNIHGMLLEEAVLYLLRASGYHTIEDKDVSNDETLKGTIASGLKIVGRGGPHQIDAIADLMIVPPFTYPQRLLVEAKCYSSKKIGIEIIRNAVGVLKDVGEYWETKQTLPAKPRYHYLYAVFSATAYTKEAQKYAFAQDIYLMPIANSYYMQPVLNSIRSITARSFKTTSIRKASIPITALRKAVRASIRDDPNSSIDDVLAGYPTALKQLQNFRTSCLNVGKAFIAMIGGRFPIFLVPNPSLDRYGLEDTYKDTYIVTIHWNRDNREKGWYLREHGRNIFSFDLPIDIFNYYAEQGFLSPARALNLKEDFLSEIQAISVINNRVRIIRFLLDRDWIAQVRAQLNSL